MRSLFVTTYNPAALNIKKILMKHWCLIENQHKLARIYGTSIIAYKKEKSLKDFLVRTKISSHVENRTKSWLKLNETISITKLHINRKANNLHQHCNIVIVILKTMNVEPEDLRPYSQPYPISDPVKYGRYRQT